MGALIEAAAFRADGFEVTDTLLRTPRKTYRLAQIEYVSVQRPLLLFAGLPAIGLIGFTIAFWRYLFAGEGIVLTTLCIVAILAAFQFSTLRVHSIALRDDELAMSFGRIKTLRRVRTAVEQVMMARSHHAEIDE